jgi:hypothetical protein
MLEEFGIQDIREMGTNGPCYDPARYLPEDWEGTIVDILRVHECPLMDRMWVATETQDLTQQMRRRICSLTIDYIAGQREKFPALSCKIDYAVRWYTNQLPRHEFLTLNFVYGLFDAVNDLILWGIEVDESCLARKIIEVIEEEVAHDGISAVRV